MGFMFIYIKVIVNTLNERGVGFHSLQENLTMDKSNATGQLMFHLFAAFAEFEQNLIEERSAAGRAAAVHVDVLRSLDRKILK